MRPGQVHNALRDVAKQRGRALTEILTLYVLERFLARLASTDYASHLVLKGGVLLAAYRLRRPTGDIDVQLTDVTLDIEHLRRIVSTVAAVGSDDGVVLSPGEMTVETIRDDDEYNGLRVHVPARLHSFAMDLKLDVSTGDPIWPKPTDVELPALLGGSVTVLGHPMITVIAEKTVTIVQRGTTSTRWRDFADVRSLARTWSFTAGDLWQAASLVAGHRHATLVPIGTVTEGYELVAQTKWAAWARKNAMLEIVDSQFGDQLAAVVEFIDPVFSKNVSGDDRWDPDRYAWVPANT